MNWTILIAALIQIESGGDFNAIGDRGLTNKAYGVLQIRQPYLTDVIRVAKKDMLKEFGKVLTLRDLYGSQESVARSKWVAKRYLDHYGKYYQRKTGKAPTQEIYARMHNGGPFGWKRAGTVGYWVKVRAELRRK